MRKYIIYCFLTFVCYSCNQKNHSKTEEDINSNTQNYSHNISQNIPPKSTIKIKRINYNTYEIINTQSNLILKKITVDDLNRLNPYNKFGKPIEGTNPIIYDLTNVSHKQKEELFKNIRINPIYQHASIKDANYLYPLDGAVVPFDNGLLIIYCCMLFEVIDNEGQIAIGECSKVIRINKEGNIDSKWEVGIGFSALSCSNDGNFLLCQTSFSAGEGNTDHLDSLLLIDLNQETNMKSFSFSREGNELAESRSFTFQNMKFFGIYQNEKGEILRIIIDPYNRILYIKWYQAGSMNTDEFEQKLYNEIFKQEMYAFNPAGYSVSRF